MLKQGKIKFVDLPRQNKILKNKLMNLIENVVDNADFTMGSNLKQFEKHFAKFCGKKYAIGVNSGTDALQLALMSYGIGKDDEVIVPANSYFSTAMVVSNIGATPILVDIDPDFFTIDVEKLKKAISHKTKAIIPVHLYGQPAQMDMVIDIAKKYKLIVIEDCAQATGAKFKGKTIPYGETGAFSFFPGKNLGAFGDGGAVVTDNKEIAEKIYYLRNDGSKDKYIHLIFGMKSRLDALQAVILNGKLPNLRKWNILRQKHANLYSKYLDKVYEVKTPSINKNAFHVFHLYVIECKDRDGLKLYLEENGVETIIHYPIPIHLQQAYKNSGFKKGDFPVSEEKADKILSLPMFPEITDKEIKYICKLINDFYKKK